MKQKILGILLLGLWVFQGAFVFLHFQIEKQKCHVQNFSPAKRSRLRAATQTFSFSKQAKINWVVAGKEFLLEGKLYDVVAITDTGDHVEVLCFPDTKEDSIIANFHRFLSGKPPLGTAHSKVEKYFALKYLKTEMHECRPAGAVTKSADFPDTPMRSSYSMEIIPPPPKDILQGSGPA